MINNESRFDSDFDSNDTLSIIHRHFQSKEILFKCIANLKSDINSNSNTGVFTSPISTLQNSHFLPDSKRASDAESLQASSRLNIIKALDVYGKMCKELKQNQNQAEMNTMAYTRNTGGNLSKVIKNHSSGNSSYTNLHCKKMNMTAKSNKSSSRSEQVTNKGIQIQKQKAGNVSNQKLMKL